MQQKFTYQEEQLMIEAYEVQDACNLSGVVHSYSRAMKALWEIANEFGYGTSWVNNHPVAALYADKCKSLTYGVDILDAMGLAHDITKNAGIRV